MPAPNLEPYSLAAASLGVRPGLDHRTATTDPAINNSRHTVSTGLERPGRRKPDSALGHDNTPPHQQRGTQSPPDRQSVSNGRAARPALTTGRFDPWKLARWSLVGLVALVGSLEANPAEAQAPDRVGPWDLRELRQVPPASFGPREGLLQPVYYQGNARNNRPTRVFAWFARPAGEDPVPGIVLVHGGGGRAFPEWAAHWARRGYAALAMDLAGHDPTGPLPDGGPGQSDEAKFGPFDDTSADQMWTTHAIAAVIRGHSLLAAQPGVDARRIGITGISWGGYLTCIAAGVDHRFRVAVPVYGCGFLHENSVWRESRLQPMEAAQRDRWVRWFDPSQYLPGVRCPILFLNGTNDFAYPLDSYRRSYDLVKQQRTLAVIPRLPHGHIWTFPEVDLFVDSVLREGEPLPGVGELQTTGPEVSTTVTLPPGKLQSAALHYTTDDGPWQKREWKSLAAQIEPQEGGSVVRAKLPEGARLVYYLAVTDSRGATVSTRHTERP